MEKDNDKDKKKGLPKQLLPWVSVFTTASFLYDVITKAASFFDLLSSEGTNAFLTFVRPAIIALIALIVSISYLSSVRKKPAKGAAGDAQAGSADAGKRSAGEAVYMFITKVCIGILILGIIVGIGWGYFTYREYMQRPKVDIVRDYIDFESAISGYDGEAVFDKDEVRENLPADIEEVYSDYGTENLDRNANYDERQEAWDEFRRNLNITYEDMAPGFTNDDEIVVRVDYQAKNLSQIKSATHLRIIGVDETHTIKVSDIKELPHRFANAAQAREEKDEVITDFENNLINSVSGTHTSDIECRSFLCKPKYGETTEPDGLAVVVKYTFDKGGTMESVNYDACYLYPFDSRASSDMITQNVDGFVFRGDFDTKDEEKLETEIRRGDKFNSNAEYSLEYIQ